MEFPHSYTVTPPASYSKRAGDEPARGWLTLSAFYSGGNPAGVIPKISGTWRPTGVSGIWRNCRNSGYGRRVGSFQGIFSGRLGLRRFTPENFAPLAKMRVCCDRLQVEGFGFRI